MGGSKLVIVDGQPGWRVWPVGSSPAATYLAYEINYLAAAGSSRLRLPGALSGLVVPHHARVSPLELDQLRGEPVMSPLGAVSAIGRKADDVAAALRAVEALVRLGTLVIRRAEPGEASRRYHIALSDLHWHGVRVRAWGMLERPRGAWELLPAHGLAGGARLPYGAGEASITRDD